MDLSPWRDEAHWTWLSSTYHRTTAMRLIKVLRITNTIPAISR